MMMRRRLGMVLLLGAMLGFGVGFAHLKHEGRADRGHHDHVPEHVHHHHAHDVGHVHEVVRETCP